VGPTSRLSKTDSLANTFLPSGIWESRRGDLIRGKASILFPKKVTSPLRAEGAGNGLQKGRFPGSIGADDGNHLPLFHLERDIADDRNPQVATLIFFTSSMVSLPQIRLDDLRVFDDLFRRVFRDFLAGVENHHPFGDGHDHLHDVLDHD